MSTRRLARAGAATVGIAAAVAAIIMVAGNSLAYERYNSGCQRCHGNFMGPVSPRGTVFPMNNKHEMHRNASFMDTECDLCHLEGFSNPFIGRSNGTPNNPGVGCTGCHGRDYGGNIGHSGVGLRAHHAVNGVNECADCHDQDPPPLPENVKPKYYGTPDTRADDPCNAGPNHLENWSIGDVLGLDNDGDNVYDQDDSDCTGGCNGNETLAKAKCKVKQGQVRGATVILKNGTPGQQYTAVLDTGQQVAKKAKSSGTAKFSFKGGNAPPCGPNAATVCNKRKALECRC